MAHTAPTVWKAGERSETTLKIWLRGCYVAHVGSLPGNAMLKTESFIVTKNGHIQRAFLSNVWQQHLWSMDPPHPTFQCSWDHIWASCFVFSRAKKTSHLGGCMPPQKTGLTPISSWRALASSSLCTSPKLLGQPPCANLRDSMQGRRLAWAGNAARLQLRADTCDYQIWNVHPGCYLPGTCCVWSSGEELGRRLGSCCRSAEKDQHLRKRQHQNWHDLKHWSGCSLEKRRRVLPNQIKRPEA